MNNHEQLMLAIKCLVQALESISEQVMRIADSLDGEDTGGPDEGDGPDDY